jgi:hypothetical protein
MKQYIMGSADESKVVKNCGIHTKYCLTTKNAKKLKNTLKASFC